MVEVGTGTSKTRFIETDWPNTEGLTAGTTKQRSTTPYLEPETSNIEEKDKVGMDY